MHFLSIFPFFMNIHFMQMSQLTLNHMQMRDWCHNYILVPSLFFYDKNWQRYDRIYAYTPCHCKEKGGCHGNSKNKHSPNEFFHGIIIEYHSVDTNRQVGTHEKKYPGGCMVCPTGPGLICRQFLHTFSVNSSVILKKFVWRSILCYVSERCLKDLNGS